MCYDSKKINSKSIKCPACGSEFDYREFIKSENVILKRYKALIKHIKEEYGEIIIGDKECLLGVIKQLENMYSITIKE